MGYREGYSKTIDELYEEELRIYRPYTAIRSAKSRLRMYANLFCRELRRSLINEESFCAKCGSKNKLTIDHITPITKGGKNSIDNIQILCSSCNIKKSNKI